MVATFGLERVEAGLRRESISAADVAEFLDQAEASDVTTLARDGMDTALHGLQQRRSERDYPEAKLSHPVPAPSLPTHAYFAQRANTEFQQTRYANPV